jgi:ATP-binding cassette, subfamily B, bacterial PglK
VQRYLDIARQAFALVGADRRWRWWLLAGISLSMTAIEAVGAALVYLLVTIISTPDAAVVIPIIGDLSSLFPDRTGREIKLVAALLVGVFFILRGAVVLLQEYVRNRLVNNSVAILAGEMLDGYLSMPYLFHTQRSSSQLIRNTYQGTQKLVTGVVLPVLSIGTEILMAVALIATLVALAPQAMLVTSLGLGLTLWVLQKVVRPRLVEYSRHVEDASAQSIGAIQQALGGIRDIKLLQREDSFAEIHLTERLRIAKANYQSAILSRLSPLAIETSLILTIVAVFVLATAGDTAVERTLATLAVFAYVGLRLQPILGSIIGFFNTINKSQAVIDNLVADRTLVQEWADAIASESAVAGLSAVPSSTATDRLTTGIRFDDVSFSYLEDAAPVLVGIDLEIRRGEFVGICGPTGGGKSTLVDLLVGLLQPTSGEITVDGIPLGRRPLWWWSQLGVVSQSVFLTDDTLRGNITFGGTVDEERLARCIRRAQLEPVVADLPDGLDTIVGERGVRLSGGQRQRVAIARALYREPEVLVLDEGTSALDGATERALVAAIDEATHERTLITIAHRISTIRSADRIIVVAGGRIVDQGTHDELLGRNELFQALA